MEKRLFINPNEIQLMACLTYAFFLKITWHGKKFVLIFQIVRVPAIGEAKATDATGAGDLFASGFLYGLVKGLCLEECCKVGSCSGGAVIRSLGGEVTPENWQWMRKHMQIKGLPIPDTHI